MAKQHFSWKDREPPRNGRESRLRSEGKPSPEWTRENVYTCRKCGGHEATLSATYGKIHRRCVACQKKSRARSDASRSGRKNTYYREKTCPPAESGPTVITTTWYHYHAPEVHARVMDGEVFLIEACGTPIGYFVPLEKYREDQ